MLRRTSAPPPCRLPGAAAASIASARAALAAALALAAAAVTAPAPAQAAGEGAPPPGKEAGRYNVLFLIADDLTYTALSCYGNSVCQTPNIDALAATGTRFTRAYCQGTYCGPSRASFLSGYYPHATGALGYDSPREAIGDRATWPQHFKNHGYHTARISKVYHMGVPVDIEYGGDPRKREGGHYDGADDPLSWSERHNTPGPEWMAAGPGETLEGNPDGLKPAVGGNTFVSVEAEGGDFDHSDGRAAAVAAGLIDQLRDRRFWLGVGFVRPHVPFVAPAKYFEPFQPYEKLVLPPKIEGAWDHIPTAGINYKTSENMQMDIRRQKTAMGAYYATVAYVDAMVGVVMEALEEAGLAEETIVIFTSDHGYHLGEHDFWAKVSLRDESAGIPLVVRVPGQAPAVSDSLVEMLDFFPTTAALCGLPVPDRLQGKDLSPLFEDPAAEVREAAFSVAPSRRGFLLRERDWAFIQYEEDASGGMELYDMRRDPGQHVNLAVQDEHAGTVAAFRAKMDAKLAEVRDNDLEGAGE